MQFNPISLNRRTFLNSSGLGLGSIALADLLAAETRAQEVPQNAARDRGVLGDPHYTPKAKRVIYLFMSGGPSQLDLYDYKPLLNERHGEQLPDSVRGGQRLTGMSVISRRFRSSDHRSSFLSTELAGRGSVNCFLTRPPLPMSCV